MIESKNEHIENLEIRSEEVQEILTKVPHWMIRWGNLLFLGLIVLLLFLAWLVKYPDIITSEAVITTSVPPQKEFAKTNGKVEALLISDNDIVNKNETLAIVENSANHKDVYLLKTTLDSIKPNNKSFSFPIDSLPVLFLGEIDTQFSLFENNYIQYQLNKQLQPFSNEALANRLSISELRRQLSNLKSQKVINKTELDLKLKDLERNKSLYKKGVISAQNFENKQLEYAQAERNYQSFEASISQLREAINNASKVTKGTEINRVKEEMQLLKNVIQSFNQLKTAIKDWEYKYVLKSNIEGRVTFLNIWNENQFVNQGDLIFTIIPTENSDYVAKLKVPVRNSGKIKAGQDVNIKLENYPDTEFGMLQGKVENISLIPNKDNMYHVDVSLSDELITTYNKQIAFKQEMLGVAEIITEDLRLIDRLFYQFKEVFKRN